MIASFRAEARGTGALLLDTGARDGLLRCDPGALTDRLRERGGVSMIVSDSKVTVSDSAA